MKRVIQLIIVMITAALLFMSCGCGNKNNDLAGHVGADDIDNAAGKDVIDSIEGTKSKEAAKPQTGTELTDGESNEPDGSEAEASEKESVFEMVERMTLDEKIGQMFIVGFEGPQPDDALKSMIVDNHVGGVILFQRNIKNPSQLLGLINAIKVINSNHIPLFISVDEEGGKVSRMPPQIKDIPSSMSIGEAGSVDLSYRLGALLAHKIKAFGFNMDFAPVLDIWSNPKNTVIGDRSFGSEPEIVSSLGIEAMKGIRNNGVISVVKHFPGHGDTIVDSHIGLPRVEYGLERLKSFELVPFQEAIDNQTDAVMIAHILMTKIDPENPATLSKAIITDLLREDMGFDGLVVTDDMTMGAITKNYNIEDAVVGSIVAGSDIILICHGYDKQQSAISAVKAAVKDGIITQDRIEESVKRILELKQKYQLTNLTREYVNVDEINRKIDELKDDM
ncbi:MAG: beta-N-acetylhexosaminidase [Clostridiaceae bacterium]|jgi:beta-N-acetylhexosaminidase|nr:beta-N-acetylhexosaminidase [Clostridiaceae bacterium]